MRRLIELCWRIEEAERSIVDRDVLMVKNSFSEAELKASTSPTTPVVKSSVDRGILHCMEEYVYDDENLKQFYGYQGT